jgi:K+-transporting ATPase ATPase A chain
VSKRFVYCTPGVNPDREQRWSWYLVSVLAFSVVSLLGLLALLILQTDLPAPWGHKGMTPLLALNTAISFTTNTSRQNYAGESTLGHVGLAAGLGVQAFASAAVGMAVAVAFIRGIARRKTAMLGNFWVDLSNTCPHWLWRPSPNACRKAPKARRTSSARRCWARWC